MAVVQISKIQVRRGRKNGESGIPQLSSGEMAWAVDTQELYIGNGSVADGAPEVGNTKVLTEQDNLLDLVDSYRFARNTPTITKSVFRSLQSKLDDRVNVKDFGAVGNGIVDDTEAFQNALDELFRNADAEFRKELFVPTGHYRIASPLAIPSYAAVIGESQVGAVIIIDDTEITLTTTAGTSLALFESSDRPHDIIFRQITFRFTTGHFDLTGLKDGSFERCTFQGTIETLSEATNATAIDPMVYISNTNKIGTTVDNITFRNCIFEKSYKAIQFDQVQAFRSNINIIGSEFRLLNSAIDIIGITEQLNDWYIDDCFFKEIARYAFKSDFGVNVKITRSRFRKCGNNDLLPNTPDSGIVIFGQIGNNVVLDCSFDRHAAAYTNVLVDDARLAYPEVINGSTVTISDQINQNIYVSFGPVPLTMFSALNTYTKLDYNISFTNGSGRAGTLEIIVGDSLAGPIITDTYSSTCGDLRPETVEFSVRLVSNSSAIAGNETMIIDYKSPAADLVPDKFRYFISYSV
jgi:hypothetical protein